jgi:hypothetical protein
MKILRIFLVMTFLISLLAGIGAGTFLFHKNSNPARTLSPTNLLSTSDQESVWIIAVDRLNIPTPKIEGIWLLTHIPSYTAIKPLPLLPSGNAQQDLELTRAFRITSDHQVGPEFWDLLHKKGHLARDYVVFDEVAAVSIINIFDGINMEGEHVSGFEALSRIPKTWDDPQGSLLGQVTIMDQVCKSIFKSHSIPDLAIFQNETGSHIISNLDLDEKVVKWQKMIESGSYKVCDFSDVYMKIKLTSNP